MRVARLAAAVALASSALAVGEAPMPAVIQAPSEPAARLALPPSLPPTSELPPLLQVPEVPRSPRPPCRPCQNDYHSSHHYLPDQSPDCRNGGCDGDCHACRQLWLDLDFFVGKAENLPNVDRRFIYGLLVGGGYWFDDERIAGVSVGWSDFHGTYSGEQAGPLYVDSPVTVISLDANFRARLFCADRIRIDGLIGYRYVQHHESLSVGTTATAVDQTNRNHIYAGQVGVIASYRYGPYFAELLGKVGYGRTSEDIDDLGIRTTANDTCLISEFGAKIAYQFGESLWCTLGYSSLYLSNVNRPGQLDTNYFLHGLTIGFEKRF